MALFKRVAFLGLDFSLGYRDSKFSNLRLYFLYLHFYDLFYTKVDSVLGAQSIEKV